VLYQSFNIRHENVKCIGPSNGREIKPFESAEELEG
jgi:hypothetical protein